MMIKPLSSVCLFLVLCACVFLSETIAQNDGSGDWYDQVVVHADRSAADQSRDSGRKPAEVFRFLGLKPGMTVLELGAGGGYTTEIASRIVGQYGEVYAQAFTGQSRLNNDRLPNVNVIEPMLLWELRKKTIAAGLKPGAADQILIFFALHDMYLNRRIDKTRLYSDLNYFLKPGGRLVILDNAAEPGSGLRDSQRTHRIDEVLIKQAITDSGFNLVSESDLLRNPQDDVTRSWQLTRPQGTHDRFVLVFEKPK